MKAKATRTGDHPRTQAARSAATRQALVAAARPLFAAHGFDVGTEAIVRAAGVTRGALYHQYADKTELFAAVVEAVEAEATERLVAAVSGAAGGDPIAMMRTGVAVWLEVCVEPEVQRILLVEAPSVLGYARWREIESRYGMGLVRELLKQAMARGRIREQPVEPLAHVLLAVVSEAALYLARADDPARARVEMAAVLDDLVSGLATG